MLVRDQFPGKRIVNALIDLPFALPTIVAGLTLLALYGGRSPVGIDIAFTQAAVLARAAVRDAAVRDPLRAARADRARPGDGGGGASLGARNATIFRRIVLPNLVPAILSGAALAFARAVGEFGSIVLISGNIPFKTQVSSVYIFNQIESDAPTSAAAVSTVLLVVSLVVLLAIRGLGRWGARHDR